MTMRSAFLALLLSIFGMTSAFAAPVAPVVKNAKLSALAKTRDRDAKGRFLANVKTEEVQPRAYAIYQARMKSGAPGSSETDYAQAKREIQTERAAANKQAKLKSMALKLGDAWGAKVSIKE